MSGARRLADAFVHLGRGGAAISLPPFEGMAWYADYETRFATDGADGRLVSLHRFEADWDSWEMHPAGAEIVLCVSGAITLIQERPDGCEMPVTLGAGDYAINERGVWHTADVAEAADVVFITAGEGTMHRPR